MLGKYQESIDLLLEHNQVNPKNFKNDQSLSCISGGIKEKNYVEVNLNLKLIYYVNLAIAAELEGNIQDVSKYINSALQCVDSTGLVNFPTN